VWLLIAIRFKQKLDNRIYLTGLHKHWHM